MAQNATVFKAELHIADVGRPYYGIHTLTIARHPSETDERMMVRLLAFALYADDALAFGKGISTDDEPALWQKDLTGTIERWIEVGLPDERLLRRACGRARRVVVLAYGRAAGTWWEQNAENLARLKNLTVIAIPLSDSQALAEAARRNMRFHITIQEDEILFASDDDAILVTPIVCRRAEGDTTLGNA